MEYLGLVGVMEFVDDHGKLFPPKIRIFGKMNVCVLRTVRQNILTQLFPWDISEPDARWRLSFAPDIAHSSGVQVHR